MTRFDDEPRFRDRGDAGERLAAVLQRLRPERPVVLGLPRGGIPVAAVVARRLEAPLDVLLVRKIGAPAQPEFAVGAVADGVQWLDEPTIRRLAIPMAAIERIVTAETEELERRQRTYRGARPPVDVRGRTAVVVDDGLATGATARAAIRSLRRRGPARIVFAVPVGAPDSLARLRAEADEVVCLVAPAEFRAVGMWYRDFSPTSDAEVIALLDEAAKRAPSAAGPDDQHVAGGPFEH